MHEIAVHLSDLITAKQKAPLAIDAFLKPDFLADNPESVRIGKNIDDDAIILSGPAIHMKKRIKAMVECLLGIIGERALGRPFRVYQQGPRGGWRRIRKIEDLR